MSSSVSSTPLSPSSVFPLWSPTAVCTSFSASDFSSLPMYSVVASIRSFLCQSRSLLVVVRPLVRLGRRTRRRLAIEAVCWCLVMKKLKKEEMGEAEGLSWKWRKV